jgi:hypothetical protein
VIAHGLAKKPCETPLPPLQAGFSQPDPKRRQTVLRECN